MGTTATLPPRISSRLAISASGCWLWCGTLSNGGYSRTAVGSRADGSRRMVRVHRYVYELLVGPIPAGLTIDHLCRVRHCCNPDHLEPVTIRENVLRGDTPAARNAAKTHCPQGHPYSDENTYVTSKRRRMCRTCRALRRDVERQALAAERVTP